MLSEEKVNIIYLYSNIPTYETQGNLLLKNRNILLTLIPKRVKVSAKERMMCDAAPSRLWV
jgi:hypothetical protein